MSTRQRTNTQTEDRGLIQSLENRELFLYQRQWLDLFIILVFIVVGTLWGNAFTSFFQQAIFKCDTPHYSLWFATCLASTAMLYAFLSFLEVPVYLFA